MVYGWSIESTGVDVTGHGRCCCPYVIVCRSSYVSVSTMYGTPLIRTHQLGSHMQKTRSLQNVLKAYKTYKEVKLVSCEHSSDSNNSYMLNPKQSGSRTKIYHYYRTVLSKKIEDLGFLSACDYCLHWTPKKGIKRRQKHVGARAHMLFWATCHPI